MSSKTFLLKTFLFLFLILGLIALFNIDVSQAAIRTITGTVTKVSDGDTIQLITTEQTKLKVRLYGIDAQESYNKLAQPYGEKAKNALDNKVMGKQVRLDIITDIISIKNRLQPFCTTFSTLLIVLL